MNVLKLVKAIAKILSQSATAICVAYLLFAAGVELTKKTFATNGVTYEIRTDSTVQVGDGEEAAISKTLKAVEIPSTVNHGKTTYTVTDIGDGAFWGCSGLTSVTLPGSLISIGTSAFGHCDNLTSVTLPNSVTTIGNFAFDRCENLTSITLSDSLKSIGDRAFASCDKLQAFVVSPENPIFCTLNGGLCKKDKTHLRLIAYPKGRPADSYAVSDGVTVIGNEVFYECSNLTSVTLPASLTSIGDRAFFLCQGLTSITIHDGVTSIGDSAFVCCKDLTSVTIPDSVTCIGDEAFFFCSALTSVTLSDSVTTIGKYAFSNCSPLTSVTLPASLTSIGDRAFASCPKLTSVSILGTIEPTVNDTTFSYGPADRVLYVPNATGGFTASKWGAASVVYGSPAGKKE